MRDEVSFDVYVVDPEERPLQGERVAAQFSYSLIPGTWSTAYTDADGHASFSGGHPATPLTVTLWVRGEGFGPYELTDGAAFTVEVDG